VGLTSLVAVVVVSDIAFLPDLLVELAAKRLPV
jgi:hypothetical protein